jgi:benzoate/toluate 1,2-dioxygenase reductase subunit
VDAVRSFLTAQSAAPANFYYEKFSGTGLMVGSGAERLKPIESDEAFDVRMALELGALQLTMGRLSTEQLTEFRRLAEATAPAVADGHFTDAAAYRESNAAFHNFFVEATSNATLIDAHAQLSVLDYMAQALAPGVDVIGDVVQDHRDLVSAFEREDLAAARDIVISHTEHAKATMRAGIAKQAAS